MSYEFKLYGEAEIPSVTVALEDYARDNDPNQRFAKAWLDKFEGFDYGAMTVWLMRGFGLPNVRAYDDFKHSFCWGLETPEGYVIEVEPGLRRIDRNEYQAAKNPDPSGDGWTQKDFQRYLLSGRVFTVHALHEDVPPVTPEIIEKWLGQFARPIYIRDVGATVLGPIWGGGGDVGPGHPSVLDGGAHLADRPTPPGLRR